jgi:large subunit ribosomal protein L16
VALFLMLLFPRKIKHKKIQRVQLKKITRLQPVFTYKKKPIRLISTTGALLESKQLEAIRKYLSKRFKGISKFYNGVFTDLPATSKPTAMRMGKGKGNFKKWLCKINSGTLLFFFKGIAYDQIKLRITKKINKINFHLKLK